MKNPNMFLIGSVVLILLAVALVAILDKSSTPNSNANDVRARASGKQALTVIGVVGKIDEAKGDIEVDNLQFSDNSRAGQPQDLGSWVIVTPVGFNFASVSVGMRVTIAVDSQTFQVSTHTLSALSVVPAK